MADPFTTPIAGGKSQPKLKVEGRLSPAVKEVARRVVLRSASRLSSSPTISKEVVLEDWWLSKPVNSDGIAVGGSCSGKRFVDGSRSRFSGSLSASAGRLYAGREFQSTQIVKYHVCNTLEDSAGFKIHLCGSIDEPRTLQNGFSHEVCRDFISGFPSSWENYSSSQYFDDILRENNLDCLTDNLESCCGAQLRDLVCSLTSAEMAVVNAKVYNQLTEKLEPPVDVGKVAGPSTPSFECRLLDVLSRLSKDGAQATAPDTYCTPNVASMKKMDCATSGGDVPTRRWTRSMKKDLVSSSEICNKNLSRFATLRTEENVKVLADACVEERARVVAQEKLPSQPTHEEGAVKLGKRKKPELAKTKRPQKTTKRYHKGMSSDAGSATLDECVYASKQRAELVADDKLFEAGAINTEGNVTKSKRRENNVHIEVKSPRKIVAIFSEKNDASVKKKNQEVIAGIVAFGECNPTIRSNKSKGSKTERNSTMKRKANEKGKPSIEKISTRSVNNNIVFLGEHYHDRRVTRSMRSRTEGDGNLKPDVNRMKWIW